MCGIAGYFGKDFKDDEIINRTFKTLYHRGPDSKGIFHTSDDYSNNLYCAPLKKRYFFHRFLILLVFESLGVFHS